LVNEESHCKCKDEKHSKLKKYHVCVFLLAEKGKASNLAEIEPAAGGNFPFFVFPRGGYLCTWQQ
jgi:hypothetical protein